MRALDGTITPINPGSDIQPQAINPAGTIVGYYADQFGTHGFVRAPNGSKPTTLDFGNGNYTLAFGINPAGAITGYYLDSGRYHGFILKPGATLPPPPIDVPPPATSTTAFAINPQGTITGFYLGGQHGFIRTSGGSFAYFDPPDSTATQPVAINPAGAITGYYTDANGPHGFLMIP